MSGKAGKTRRRKKLSSAEKQRRHIQRKFGADLRTVFQNAGFEHIDTRNSEITVDGITTDYDAVFAYENIIVLAEETTADDIKDHLRKKAEIYRHVLDGRQVLLLDELCDAIPAFAKYVQHAGYEGPEFKIKFVYFSLKDADVSYRTRYRDVCQFADNSVLQYFVSLTRSIQRSARFELFKFLGLELRDIGHASSGFPSDEYDAHLIPEGPSGFPHGHKLVSFLASPDVLLERAYVLRTDSWLDSEALYQRLLVRRKLADMRRYLVHNHRVFVNNLIVSLPSDTQLLRQDGSALGQIPVNEMRPIRVRLPRRLNSIGVIDGQHRIFSYHEGNDEFEARIGALRSKQHLLVTGIVYPEGIQQAKSHQFEAKLFLEINGKQKSVPPELKQAIELIVDPYSDVAVAKAVVRRLGLTGPLAGKLSVHFFDRTAKLKTASIVQYGLKQIVRLGKDDTSLFSRWAGPGKKKVLAKKSRADLINYVNFAASEINKLLAGFKMAHPTLWVTDRSKSRALTATAVNGFIVCLRHLVEQDKLKTEDGYRKGFAKMRIDFRPGGFQYKSSHWKRLGDELFAQCFSRKR